MSEKVKITFTRDGEAREGGDETTRAGRTMEVPPATAERWIRRGAAVLASELKKAEEEAAAKKKEEKK